MVEFLKKFSSKFGGTTEEEDIEDYLETLGIEEETWEEEADIWIKPIVLESDKDSEKVIQEIQDGSIVLINIEPLYKRNKNRLKKALDEVKKFVDGIDGDIVRVSEYKILVTPKGIKVFRGKKK